MDLQSFIQSGLLEAYVLGQCSAEERAQVERMASEHALVRAELSSIEASLEGYAAAHAVQPPDWMKSRILERIDQETVTNSVPEAPKAKSNRATLRLFQFLTFLLAAICSFLFLRQKDLGRENLDLKATTVSVQQALDTCQQHLQTPDPITELICDPSTQRYLVSDGKGINTIVYFNARLNRMAYDPYGLPAPPSGGHYQFWAIVDGQPVSMGMKANNMCESVQTVSNPQTFAISEEPNASGSATPTTVLAIGKPI
jgi:anti-sigma-K factor RskA